jgi:hypothetical protein
VISFLESEFLGIQMRDRCLGDPCRIFRHVGLDWRSCRRLRLFQFAD